MWLTANSRRVQVRVREGHFAYPLVVIDRTTAISAEVSSSALRRSELVLGLRRGALPEPFWALRDVSFDVRQGESVGLIGSNGAGKSTVLKILSRVTVPTTGRFGVRGKVGARIELGAGFHPELAGRENISLNGAIMGMRRAEIDAKFDSIVAFSEIEPFIDTPIKHYSSGMTVRLGFAVAAHINPDILLVDEVLAVGDAAFQAKCLNKLAELREQAKTIVLVSRNMTNIIQHCNRVVWLDRGTVRAVGDPETIVEEYLRAVSPSAPSIRMSPYEMSRMLALPHGAADTAWIPRSPPVRTIG